jgi:L-fucose isomerase-like protein
MPFRIAFLPLVRTTFDVPLAVESTRQARQHLLAAGFEIFEPEQPITDLQAAQQAARQITDNQVDLLVIYQATFADSTMVLALAKASDVPVFLWAAPEPWTGERLRLNSLCGINLAAHALTLRQRKYQYAYSLPQEPAVIQKIRSLAAAGSLRWRLKSAHLGVIGDHPVGMDSCHLDEASLRDIFGVHITRIELEEVFARARNLPETAIDQTRTRLDSRLDNLASLEQIPLRSCLSVYHALKEIAAEKNLDGLAVRCWPEFFTEMGCAACGAMSLLSDGFGAAAPLPCSCEADINGTLTQLMLQWLSDSPAFGTDMVGVDTDKDRVALWHCGLAPLSMADPNRQPHGGIHSNRHLPLVMDFPLKPGTVTLARVSQATGSLRLVLGKGEMLAEPKPFSGTAGILKLDCSAEEFLNLLLREGLEHHISLTYGDYSTALQFFADLIDLPVLTIGKKEEVVM